MILWNLFVAFLIPATIGYGGGPASIPLVQHEVVNRYKWMTNEQFGEMLAMANTLPGPIATKMAGYVGYTTSGWLGAFIAIIATVAPSLLLMLLLMSFLAKFKNAPQVKRLTGYIRPVICILLLTMTLQFFTEGATGSGWIHTIVLIVSSYFFLEIKKLHPAIVILGALLYGGIFLS
ncbi:chromate transporter [Bacillaceae bacterium SIJ1]|uniref:chromate transporter n=1 Tax=Litoribacterium kuwaitense TaxID=1398745 RepID=UPI0013EA82E8|nr:chromate transporter [Litoribacterium kuwaitense]NGP45408.1 chromate transporter [Litoribacterium kuwaitense]